MRRAIALLLLVLLSPACASRSSESLAASETPGTDAVAQLDSVTWPSSPRAVDALLQRLPDRIAGHERMSQPFGGLAATYGGKNPNAADIFMVAMSLADEGVSTPVGDRLAQLRSMMADSSGVQEKASSPGGDTSSAYVAYEGPVSPNRPDDIRYALDWIPPEGTWLYIVGAKDAADRDAAVLAMIEAAKGTGTPAQPTAPLGLDQVAWPTDPAGAQALLARMPSSIAGLPISSQRQDFVAYGAASNGAEPVQIVLLTSGPGEDIVAVQFAAIGMGYPVLKVESQNEHPSSAMVWFEAKVGPPAPGGSIAYAISWAPTDGTVAYAVVAETPELRSEVVAAMASVT